MNYQSTSNCIVCSQSEINSRGFKIDTSMNKFKMKKLPFIKLLVTLMIREAKKSYYKSDIDYY